VLRFGARAESPLPSLHAAHRKPPQDRIRLYDLRWLLMESSCFQSELQDCAGLSARSGLTVTEPRKAAFDIDLYLSTAGPGRSIIEFKKKDTLFLQEDAANAAFFLVKGSVKVFVVSPSGKEATIMLLSPGDFAGEEAVAARPGKYLVGAMSLTPSVAVRITRAEAIRAIHEEPSFCDRFVSFLLARESRVQSDLVDQIFNRVEKRLARALLLMAEYGQPGPELTTIPSVSQETLATMIGTTRTRINFFMNRFRSLGLIEYNSRIKVHKSLLNVILHD
jgi:CRP/FNR family transcriptional regulator, cyclic AMP receptor protein